MAKPTGKHIMVMLGIGGKPDSGGAPPPRPGRSAPPSDDEGILPDGSDTSGGEGPNEDEANEKTSPERALYAGPEETCGNCENWLPPNSCSKVDVTTDRNGRCFAHFEPKGGGQPMGAAGMPMMPPPPAGGVQ